jgi:L-threonylcarbamoyladenylate synthase
VSRLIASADPGAIDAVASALGRGGLVAIPTETVYGLAVLPVHTAIERLIEAKQRSTDKGVQLLIDSLEQANSLAELTPAAAALADHYWPGPLTLVLARRPDVRLPEILGGGRPTLGLRLPDHAVPRALARRLGPICASSANVSGHPAATTAEQVAATLGDLVEVIMDDGPVRGGVASTVVACLPGAPVEVLREGALSAAEVNAATAKLG